MASCQIIKACVFPRQLAAQTYLLLLSAGLTGDPEGPDWQLCGVCFLSTSSRTILGDKINPLFKLLQARKRDIGGHLEHSKLAHQWDKWVPKPHLTPSQPASQPLLSGVLRQSNLPAKEFTLFHGGVSQSHLIGCSNSFRFQLQCHSKGLLAGEFHPGSAGAGMLHGAIRIISVYVLDWWGFMFGHERRRRQYRGCFQHCQLGLLKSY